MRVTVDQNLIRIGIGRRFRPGRRMIPARQTPALARLSGHLWPGSRARWRSAASDAGIRVIHPAIDPNQNAFSLRCKHRQAVKNFRKGP